MIVGGWRPVAARHQAPRLRHREPARLHRRHRRRHPDRRARRLPLVLAHGLFKSTFFLVVGVVDHAGTARDLRRLSGLGRRMLPVSVPAAFAGLSMAGVIPMAGFVSKGAPRVAVGGGPEAAPFPSVYGYLALAAVVVGSALTVAYTCRFLWGAFATAAACRRRRSPRRTRASSSRPCCSGSPASRSACSRRSSPRGSCRMPSRSPPARLPTRSPCGTCRCSSRSSPRVGVALFVQRGPSPAPAPGARPRRR